MRDVQVTISDTETVSSAARCAVHQGGRWARQSLVAIIMPAEWDAADLLFQASNDGTTFYDMINTNGDDITVTAPVADEWIAIAPQDFVGVEYLKVVSSAAQSPARTLTLLFREVA